MENETHISTKLRNLMLGALYKIGDPEKQDSILEAWELSKLFNKHFLNTFFKIKRIYLLYLMKQQRNGAFQVHSSQLITLVKRSNNNFKSNHVLQN
jgi:hypothetical protein